MRQMNAGTIVAIAVISLLPWTGAQPDAVVGEVPTGQAGAVSTMSGPLMVVVDPIRHNLFVYRLDGGGFVLGAARSYRFDLRLEDYPVCLSAPGLDEVAGPAPHTPPKVRDIWRDLRERELKTEQRAAGVRIASDEGREARRAALEGEDASHPCDPSSEGRTVLLLDSGTSDGRIGDAPRILLADHQHERILSYRYHHGELILLAVRRWDVERDLLAGGLASMSNTGERPENQTRETLRRVLARRQEQAAETAPEGR